MYIEMYASDKIITSFSRDFSLIVFTKPCKAYSVSLKTDVMFQIFTCSFSHAQFPTDIHWSHDHKGAASTTSPDESSSEKPSIALMSGSESPAYKDLTQYWHSLFKLDKCVSCWQVQPKLEHHPSVLHYTPLWNIVFWWQLFWSSYDIFSLCPSLLIHVHNEMTHCP